MRVNDVEVTWAELECAIPAYRWWHRFGYNKRLIIALGELVMYPTDLSPASERVITKLVKEFRDGRR